MSPAFAKAPLLFGIVWVLLSQTFSQHGMGEVWKFVTLMGLQLGIGATSIH